MSPGTSTCGGFHGSWSRQTLPVPAVLREFVGFQQIPAVWRVGAGAGMTLRGQKSVCRRRNPAKNRPTIPTFCSWLECHKRKLKCRSPSFTTWITSVIGYSWLYLPIRSRQRGNGVLFPKVVFCHQIFTTRPQYGHEHSHHCELHSPCDYTESCHTSKKFFSWQVDMNWSLESVMGPPGRYWECLETYMA